ncbi:MAG TPA: aminoglycoside phosphotransferase family protein [Anaerolineales bacterium]|nr:aminoglycoside phosphotransferase family protein [Anaerolineales bacterium]
MTEQTELQWQNPDWQKEAHDWILTKAERNSIRLTGEIEQPHIQHWSTVIKVPSSEGMLFFKATAGETIYEIALTEKLAGWFPKDMPELLAVDALRGWMLMRDGGEQLRASIRPANDIEPWEPVISRYAKLQIGLAEHVEEMLALGIPDHRLNKLPALYSQVLTDEPSLMIGKEKGLTSEEFKQLQDLAPRFEQICDDLDKFSIPASINHGDFHDGNVLVKDGRITFFDWGDADVTHPFVSLRTWFVSMEITLELDDYAPPTPAMTELLHRYLERWEGYGSKEELLKAYELSRPVASIVKTMAWHLTISRMNNDLRAEYAWIVPEVLREFMIYEKMLKK